MSMRLIQSNQITMSSREIAELVQSRHDSVKRTIERCAEKGVFAIPPTVEYLDMAGRGGQHEYLLQKRDSLIVVAQLCPEFTARIVDRWQELEVSQPTAIPKSFSEALRQAAAEAADDAIARAAGVTAAKMVERPVCLVTSFAERADLPPGALLCRMSAEVAATLAGMGLHQPVSLRQLPGKWWIADIDAAAENPHLEPGGCSVTKVFSTEALQHRFGEYYCHVVAGPFSESPGKPAR